MNDIRLHLRTGKLNLSDTKNLLKFTLELTPTTDHESEEGIRRP